MAKSSALVLAGQDGFNSLSPDQTLRASKALLAQISKEAKQSADSGTKKNLLDDPADGNSYAVNETPIWLVVSTKRHVRTMESLKPIRVAVPHPINQDPSRTICLITATPQRAYKNIVASDEFPEELRSRITRVIDFTKLQAKFKRFEEQRQLLHEHDIFLADDRIVNRLPKALGKTFYKSATKRPVPVVLAAKRLKEGGKRVKRSKTDEPINAGTPKEIAAEIEKAIGSALVTLKPSDSVSIIVGYASFKPEQIAANVAAVTAALVSRRIPQQWENVKGIYIKGPRTVALPIWQTSRLWANETDVVAGPEPELEAKPIEEGKQKAEGVKKRKSLDGAEVAKKQKKTKVKESNDDALDLQIAERKARLVKQKAKAKAAMED